MHQILGATPAPEVQLHLRLQLASWHQQALGEALLPLDRAVCYLRVVHAPLLCSIVQASLPGPLLLKLGLPSPHQAHSQPLH